MATGRGNQLTKQVGEFMVSAELARRGWLMAILTGNTPDLDLVATDVQGRSVPIQVKAVTGASWQFDVARFVSVTMEGDRQKLGELMPFPEKLVCTLVVVGSRKGEDRFFLMPMRVLQNQVVDNHRAWLAKHAGVRPRNPKSTHCSMPLDQIAQYEDNWEVVESSAR